MTRLVDHAEKQAEGLPLRLDDIADQPVTIQGARWNSGNFGPYAVMTIVNPDGEVLDLMTSASLVLDALEHAEAADDFPCEAIFSKRGRTWIIS